jgi:catechol 2,3-dioxygenase-like lactoylglutathione lyase family enzyme
MALTTLKLVSVPVADQDEARAFYVEALGFSVVRDERFGERQRWLEVAPPGGGTSVALVTWFEAMPPGSAQGLVLSSDDVEHDHAELSGRGVPFASGIESAPWGRFATFTDPDGNGWVLQQDA